MSKTLSNILTVFKVVRVIAKVVFILCIVGGAGCLLGLAMLPLANVPFLSEALAEAEIGFASSYFACIAGAFICAGEAVFARLTEKYCQKVINEGTPFSFDGANECFRLGIASIIITVALEVATGVTAGVILLLSEASTLDTEIDITISLTTGLVFLFLSMIFKHGAELQAPVADLAVPAESTEEEEQKAEQKEEQESETTTL